MAANLTYQLLLVLVLAAALGGVIGAALMQIKTIRANRVKSKQAQQQMVSTNKLNDQLTDMQNRYAALQRAGIEESELLSVAKTKANEAHAQQDALQVHSRLQAQRIANLESSLVAAEERGLRVQRDFETYKSHKQQELAMSRRSMTQSQTEERTDSDLPVLNKRVSATAARKTPHTATHHAASVEAIRAMLDEQSDIPALAESELPGSINDIDFEFEKLWADEADPVG